MLGMTPKRYREGGKGMEIQFALGECSLGSILVASSEKGICAISLGNDPEQLLQAFQQQFANASLRPGGERFDAWVSRVVAFVEEPGIGLSLPLDIRGTAFQQRVWQALTEIPVGRTISYSTLAERIGSPKAVRAVARACASNAIALAIPCHRVVRTDGALAGYRWGVEKKRTLLMREARQTDATTLSGEEAAP